jgi:hypothetical protein
VKVTLPLASVLQVAGPQVPTMPPFWPVTVNVTSWPTLALPLLVTWAVTVCLEPVGPVACNGVSEMSGADVEIPAPATIT